MSHDPIETQKLPEDDFFGEPISVYTDAEALEDGILVDLGQFPRVAFLELPINRMTSHLFDDLKPFLEPDAEGDVEEFGLALASTLQTKCQFAESDPGNRGEVGDICRIPPNLWLVRNEVGGWTAMYPEDY
jgi:hypothetical protein